MFIMLLAFFIVLAALSNFEEQKGVPVIESLNYAFSSNVQQRGPRPGIEQDEEQQSTEEGDTTVDRLDALFRAQISNISDPDIDKMRGTMRISMTRDQFEDALESLKLLSIPQQSMIDTAPQSFLRTLVSLLDSDDMGVPYHMAIIINKPQSAARLAKEDPEVIAEIMARTAQYAKILQDAGLPIILMNFGTGKGQADMIDLFFKPYSPYDPVKGEFTPPALVPQQEQEQTQP